MAKVSRQILYSFFETGDKPTQAQFASLIQSMLNFQEDRNLLGLKEYDGSQTYLTGDSVIHDLAIYQAIMQTTGSFNPTAWKKIAGSFPGVPIYKGTWNANTNVPDIAVTAREAGSYYIVNVAGHTDLDGITDWNVGDWAIYNGTNWEKIASAEVVNNGENVEGSGIGVFKQKSGSILQFKKIQTNDGSLYVAVDLGNNFIDLGINFDDATSGPNRAWSSLKTATEIQRKIDKPTSSTPLNFAVFGSGGNLQDTGINAGSFLPADTVAEDIPVTPAGHIFADNVQLAIEELDFQNTETENALTAHVGNMENPHMVTKAQIGLENVTNDVQLSLKFYEERTGPMTTGSDFTLMIDNSFATEQPGHFLVEWYCEIGRGDKTPASADIIMYFNDEVIGSTNPYIDGNGNFLGYSGFCMVGISDTDSKRVQLGFRQAFGTAGVIMRNARVKIVKS